MEAACQEDDDAHAQGKGGGVGGGGIVPGEIGEGDVLLAHSGNQTEVVEEDADPSDEDAASCEVD